MPQNTRDRPSSGEKWPTRVGDLLSGPPTLNDIHQIFASTYKRVLGLCETCSGALSGALIRRRERG